MKTMNSTLWISFSEKKNEKFENLIKQKIDEFYNVTFLSIIITEGFSNATGPGISSFLCRAELKELSTKNKVKVLFVLQAEPVKFTGMDKWSKSLMNRFGFSKFWVFWSVNFLHIFLLNEDSLWRTNLSLLLLDEMEAQDLYDKSILHSRQHNVLYSLVL